MANHAILSPSGAYRWSICTPSARFEEQIPEEETYYSTEGDLAHELAAFLLKHNFEPYPFVNYRAILSKHKSDIDSFYAKQGEPSYYEEMLEHAAAWVEFINSFGTFDEYEIETRLDLSEWVPLSYGRGDFMGRIGKRIINADYKYGEGVYISAYDNPQLKLYGLGGLSFYKKKGLPVHEVLTAIFQPRVQGVSVESYEPDELVTWSKSLKEAAKEALSGQGEFVAGEHCQFCKAKLSCRAYFEKFETILNIRDKREVTLEDKKTVARLGDGISKYVKDVKDELRNEILKGKPIEGFKVVNGKKTRAFATEWQLFDTLIGEGLEHVLTTEAPTLTSLEKQLGKKRFEELFSGIIIKREGQARLVNQDDPGEEYNPAPASDYDD